MTISNCSINTVLV